MKGRGLQDSCEDLLEGNVEAALILNCDPGQTSVRLISRHPMNNEMREPSALEDDIFFNFKVHTINHSLDRYRGRVE